VPFPVMVVPLLNGGAAFAGKSGRDTANPWEANAIRTNVMAAAHFITRGLIQNAEAWQEYFLRSAGQILPG
jgi:hypothetical protein